MALDNYVDLKSNLLWCRPCMWRMTGKQMILGTIISRGGVGFSDDFSNSLESRPTLCYFFAEEA